MNVYVSGAVTLVSLGIALVMWTVGRKHWPYVILALVATGFGGIMQSTIGGWIRTGTGKFGDMVAKVAGRVGVEVGLGALAVILVVYLAYKLKHQEIDRNTLMALAATVVVAGAIPGIVGTILSYGFGCIAWLVTFSTGLLFGIH
jgi:hypothetical protein